MSKTPPPGAIDYQEACSLLGLPCTADPKDIDDDQLKKAFRKAALKAHPDKGGSDDAFRKVKAASECIVRAKKHGISRVNDVIDSDDDENNFEAFFDEEGDDIMAEIILRMFVAVPKSISRRIRILHASLVGFHIGTRWRRGEVPLEVREGRSAIWWSGYDAQKSRSASRPRNLLEWPSVWKSKFYSAFVLNRRVVLHAIDATPAR